MEQAKQVEEFSDAWGTENILLLHLHVNVDPYSSTELLWSAANTKTKEVEQENLVPMKFEFTGNPIGKPKRELYFSKLKEALHSISLNNIPVPRAQALTTVVKPCQNIY